MAKDTIIILSNKAGIDQEHQAATVTIKDQMNQ